ncbi:MAG: hypothetical protein ACI4WM_03740 [Erysipelotrichaceae bacterium]
MKELFKEYLMMIFYFVVGLLIISVFMSFVYSLDNSTDLGNIIINYEVTSAFESYHVLPGGNIE